MSDKVKALHALDKEQQGNVLFKEFRLNLSDSAEIIISERISAAWIQNCRSRWMM